MLLETGNIFHQSRFILTSFAWVMSLQFRWKQQMKCRKCFEEMLLWINMNGWRYYFVIALALKEEISSKPIWKELISIWDWHWLTDISSLCNSVFDVLPLEQRSRVAYSENVHGLLPALAMQLVVVVLPSQYFIATKLLNHNQYF